MQDGTSLCISHEEPFQWNHEKREITHKLEPRARQANHSLEGPKATKSKKPHLNSDFLTEQNFQDTLVAQSWYLGRINIWNFGL